ncbi:aminotransferase class V-fold PLP-dependent enzyme, partial [Lactobacillus gallinarum]
AIYGPKENHTGVFSFNLKNIHPHDVATALDMQGIEVRAGHHCAQPLMRRLGVESTVRASLSFYNNKEDIDQLIAGISETEEFFNGTK